MSKGYVGKGTGARTSALEYLSAEHDAATW